jgi:hypothetical protein
MGMSLKVRIFIIDTLNPVSELIRVVSHSYKLCDRVGLNLVKPVIFTSGVFQSDFIDFRCIEKLNGRDDYSRFCVERLCGYWRDDCFGLLVQLDGYPINEYSWCDDFLDYDYIGAPWPSWVHKSYLVGNGGFSLRSAKFIRACAHFKHRGVPEDRALCVDYHADLEDRFGIRFAPVEVAARFSTELIQTDISTVFGFHGFYFGRKMWFGM